MSKRTEITWVVHWRGFRHKHREGYSRIGAARQRIKQLNALGISARLVRVREVTVTETLLWE